VPLGLSRLEQKKVIRGKKRTTPTHTLGRRPAVTPLNFPCKMDCGHGKVGCKGACFPRERRGSPKGQFSCKVDQGRSSDKKTAQMAVVYHPASAEGRLPHQSSGDRTGGNEGEHRKQVRGEGSRNFLPTTSVVAQRRPAAGTISGEAFQKRKRRQGSRSKRALEGCATETTKKQITRREQSHAGVGAAKSKETPTSQSKERVESATKTLVRGDETRSKPQ